MSRSSYRVCNFSQQHSQWQMTEAMESACTVGWSGSLPAAMNATGSLTALCSNHDRANDGRYRRSYAG